MIIINKWIGGLGNNILQLIRALYYSTHINKHYIIKFPSHKYLNANQIIINKNFII